MQPQHHDRKLLLQELNRLGITKEVTCRIGSEYATLIFQPNESKPRLEDWERYFFNELKEEAEGIPLPSRISALKSFKVEVTAVRPLDKH